MKKILFYIDHRNRGGAQRVMVELVNYFQKYLGYNVALVTHGKSSENAYSLVSDVKEIIMEPCSQNSFIKKQMHRIKELKKICVREKPDIIITFLIVTNIIALIVGRIMNIPVLISVRNDPTHDHSKFLHVLMRMTYPMAKGWVFQTRDAKKYFKNWIKGKAEIIINPISTNVLEEIENGKITGENEGNIVAVGRLDKQKRHDILITAFKSISDVEKDCKLVIYGEGPERQKLQNLIEESGLENRVVLPGITANIVEKIRSARLFVLASDYEGIPNALLEAMAVGLPVISTDCPCGGPSMIIEDGVNGILVPVGDSEMLREKLKLVMNNSEMADAMGKEAAKIKEKYDLKIIAKQWQDIVEDILNI